MNKQTILGMMGFGALLFGCDPVYSAPEVSIKSGHYHFYINGVQELKDDGKPVYKTLDTTAKAYAINLSFECGCMVTIKQPSLEVTTKTTAIVVTEPLDSLVLTWDLPTKREDGSDLLQSEIESFIIRGTYNGAPIDPITVTGSRYTVRNLAKGTYVFTIATTTVDGLTGQPSKPIMEVL